LERLQRVAGDVRGDTVAERAALAVLSHGLLCGGPASRAADLAQRALGDGKLL
jgi:hypothetical protein